MAWLSFLEYTYNLPFFSLALSVILVVKTLKQATFASIVLEYSQCMPFGYNYLQPALPSLPYTTQSHRSTGNDMPARGILSGWFDASSLILAPVDENWRWRYDVVERLENWLVSLPRQTCTCGHLMLVYTSPGFLA